MDMINTSVEVAVSLLLETAKQINEDCYSVIAEDCMEIIKHINQHKTTLN